MSRQLGSQDGGGLIERGMDVVQRMTRTVICDGANATCCNSSETCAKGGGARQGRMPPPVVRRGSNDTRSGSRCHCEESDMYENGQTSATVCVSRDTPRTQMLINESMDLNICMDALDVEVNQKQIGMTTIFGKMVSEICLDASPRLTPACTMECALSVSLNDFPGLACVPRAPIGMVCLWRV